MCVPQWNSAQFRAICGRGALVETRIKFVIHSILHVILHSSLLDEGAADTPVVWATSN